MKKGFININYLKVPLINFNISINFAIFANQYFFINALCTSVRALRKFVPFFGNTSSPMSDFSCLVAFHTLFRTVA